MTGSYIITFLFVGYSAFYLIGTGIYQIKSKNPVGFYTGNNYWKPTILQM